MYSNSNISREDSKNHLDHLDHDVQYVVSICFDYILAGVLKGAKELGVSKIPL